MKQAGRDNFTNIPNGSPGAGDRFAMIWTYGVETGRISKNKFVELISSKPAKINGIYPRKGAIQVGSDADIVILTLTTKVLSDLKIIQMALITTFMKEENRLEKLTWYS